MSKPLSPLNLGHSKADVLAQVDAADVTARLTSAAVLALITKADVKAKLVQIENNAYTTAARPTVTVAGTCIFDTTLGKPIWWNGSGWVDATGTTA